MTEQTTPAAYTPDWQLFADAEQLAQQATDDILKAAADAIETRGAFHIVLAGGTTPKVIYRLLAKANSDWQHWHLYLGDERCLPTEDAERNSVMVEECLLSSVAIPSDQVHFMPSELGPHEAATQYQATISKVECFDMVLLGMGEDGHTASLFPGHIHDEQQLVHPVLNAPKPPPERVSLSSACLSNNVHLLILITGTSKHPRVIDWISGKPMPVSRITSKQNAAVYCDHAAWLGSH